MADHQEYKIAGHSVLFPCKPYPSQFSMMDKIIKGIVRSQNCLLESPTGSGKSLALLCSALAWQAAEKKKQEKEITSIADGQNKACQCSCHSHSPDAKPHHPETGTTNATPATAATVTATPQPDPVVSPSTSQTENPQLAAPSAVAGCDDGSILIDDDSDEDFKPLQKFKDPRKTSTSTKKKRAKLTIEYEGSPSGSPSPSTSMSTTTPAVMSHQSDTDPRQTPSSSKAVSAAPDSCSPCSHCDCKEGSQGVKARKVPKIFFGTRTHKQVAQIVRELKKTAYHDVAMTILASREHTCIHSQVSKMNNKNEGCENLNKEVGCGFKDRVLKFQSQSAIKALGLHSAWDLEDLVHLMKKKKACPYFLSRGLKDQSDLIICPYNYLVDPLIRDSMEINLTGQIVLLDEAHNIEDSVREAASQSITQEQLQKALSDMDDLMLKGVKIADISKLRQMLHKLDMFIEEQSPLLTQHDFQQSYRMWSGFEIIAQLQHLDLGPQKCEQLVSTLASIKSAEAEERQYAGGQDLDTLSSSASSVLEQIFLVLKYMYKANMKHAEDYRFSVVKSVKYVSVANLNGSWLNSRKNFGGRKTAVEVHTLNFWCMNPAVGFADFETCRSVILTSGTLSPMDSFQSELGLPFPIVMEANHIIKDSQFGLMCVDGVAERRGGNDLMEYQSYVWVGAVGEGPNKEKLQAVYRNMETFDFQDGLGQLILGVCTKIPKGVLCFLPSYKALEKLTNRWKATGLWERLMRHKRLMCEPRGSDREDFELTIQQFYKIIHSCEQNDASGVDGALFFAVCRGKVSEGMDFADNFARAVITVGIPYPNFKDLQVELKRKYNDKYHSTRSLLSGHLWYEIQAFRALNQALGRCIRHRKDWGALIIVDDRFVKMTNKYANGLSKWVRQKLHVHDNCSSMLESLSDFTQARLEADAQDTSLNSSQLPSTPLTPATRQPASTALSPSTPLLPPTPTSAQDSRVPLYDVSNVATSSTTTASILFLSTPVTTSTATKSDRPHTITSFVNKREVSAGSDVIITGVTGQKKKQAVSGRPVSGGPGHPAVTLSSPAPAVTSVAAGVTGSSSAATSAGTMVASKAVVGNPQGQLSTGSAAKVRIVSPSTAVPVPTPVLPDIGAGTNMLFIPVTDPSMQATLLKLPLSSPTQTVLCLPPQFSKAAGTEVIAVPPGIQHVILARTLDEATAFFMNSGQPCPAAAQSLPLAPLHPVAAATLNMATPIPYISAPTISMATPTFSIATPTLKVATPALNTALPKHNVASGISLAGAGKGGGRNGNLRTTASHATIKSLLASPSPAVKGNVRLVQQAVGKVTTPKVATSNAKVSASIAVPPHMKQTHKLKSLLGHTETSTLKSASKTKGSTQQHQALNFVNAGQQKTAAGGKMKMVQAKNSSLPSSSPSTSVSSAQNVRISVENSSSQKSNNSTPSSPALFDDSPKSLTPAVQEASPTAKAKVLPGQPKFTIPSPSKMRTRARGGSATPKTPAAGASCESPIADSPSPQGNTRGKGKSPHVPMSSDPQDNRKPAVQNLPNTSALPKKRLFRNTPSKALKMENSLPEPACQPETEHPSSSGSTNNLRITDDVAAKPDTEGGICDSVDVKVISAPSAESAQESVDDSGEERLERRVRGAKRSLSLSRSRKGKRKCDGLTDETSTSSMKCVHCGFNLLDSIKDSDFERRENMPSCLKGMVDLNEPHVLYFKGTAVVDHLNLPASAIGDCRKQQNTGGVEASVQLIRCPGCHDLASLLGAKVTLTDTATATSTGQMWIFTHMVTMEKNVAETA